MAKTAKKAQTNYMNGFHRRGCGWPIAGGTYAAVDPDTLGEMFWELVMCPTIPVTEEFISMSAIGMALKERPGAKDKNGNPIYDLFDWIGGEAYPNPTDWLFEVKELGFHQKVNPTLMQWLTEESMYFAVHARAGYVDPTMAYATRVDHPNYPRCPAGHESHDIEPKTEGVMAGDYYHLKTCVGLFLSDITKGSKAKDNRATTREMPSFSYDGYVMEPTIQQEGLLEYEPAIFFRLPIGLMAEFLVYEDTNENGHVDALQELEKLDQDLQRVKVIPFNPNV